MLELKSHIIYNWRHLLHALSIWFSWIRLEMPSNCCMNMLYKHVAMMCLSMYINMCVHFCVCVRKAANNLIHCQKLLSATLQEHTTAIPGPCTENLWQNACLMILHT